MVTSAAGRQLDAVAEEFAEVRAKFTMLESRVSDADWGRRPSPAEWSVAECVAHLNLTSAAMVPALRRAVTEAMALSRMSQRPYKQVLLGRVLSATIGPVRIVAGFKLGKVATPPPFVPGSTATRDVVRNAFLEWQEDELQLVRDAADLSIDQVRIESPFRAGLFYDGYSALLILPRHEMRHLVQAERALEALRR